MVYSLQSGFTCALSFPFSPVALWSRTIKNPEVMDNSLPSSSATVNDSMPRQQAVLNHSAVSFSHILPHFLPCVFGFAYVKSVRLFVPLSVYPSIDFVHSFVCLSVRPSVRPPVFSSIRFCIHPLLRPFVSLSIPCSVILFLRLSIHPLFLIFVHPSFRLPNPASFRTSVSPSVYHIDIVLQRQLWENNLKNEPQLSMRQVRDKYDQ